MTEPYRVLNFGAGVQSTALLALITLGKLPRPDRVIMADTGWEPPEVLAHAEDCRKVCDYHNLPFDIVRLANIRQDHINRATGLPVKSGFRVLDPTIRAMRAIPLFTLMHPEAFAARLAKWQQAKDAAILRGEIWTERKPVRNGMLRRSCTERYKVQPVNRQIRLLLREPANKGRPVEQWFGISTDEAQRERISQRRNWAFRYPLLYDLPMSRKQCIELLASMGITAPKSACIGCPYRNRVQWDYIRSRPDLWADAVAFDRAIRHMPGLDSLCFLHPQRVPLDEVDWEKQGTTEEHHGMAQECVGMCGL